MKTVHNVTKTARIIRTVSTGSVSEVSLYSPSFTSVTVRNNDRSMPFSMDIVCLKMWQKFTTDRLPSRTMLINSI